MPGNHSLLRSMQPDTSLAQAFILAVVCWLCFLWYRLYLHPLSSFPGPRLAALTRWYGFYFDVIQHGAFLRHKDKLHEVYGDIVRVGPNELSFRDPRAYSDIYAQGSQFTKDPHFYECFGVPKASPAIINPKYSKERREMLLPFFSRRAIGQLEHVVEQKVDTLVQRILSEGINNTPVNLLLALRCTTLEIISAYSLNYSPSALNTPGFMHPFLISSQQWVAIIWIFKYIPIIRPLVQNPPQYLLNLLPQKARGAFDFLHQIDSQLDKILENPQVLLADNDRETVYHHLLGFSGNTELDIPEEKHQHHKLSDREELLQEAQALLLAGSDTVGLTCNIGFLHILSNHDVLQRLTAELALAWPDPDLRVPTSTLEKLPYLTAVIKETLRVSFGIVSSLPRVVGPDATKIGGVLIPAGTIVSESVIYVHMNPAVFPNPDKFDPDRWLSPESKNLESSLVAFSKGPRSCIGVNLAWHELYRIFGSLLRKVNLTLHDTTVDDFKEYDDFFIPVYRGRQLHVTVEKR